MRRYGLLPWLLLPSAAFAQEDAWRVSVVPYVWGARLEGDAQLGPLPPVSVHQSFSDTLEHLDMAAMAIIDVRRGCWGLLSDLTWVDTSETAQVPRVGLDAELQTRIVTGSLMGQYRFIDYPVFRMDAIAGARYWQLRGDVDFPALGRDASVSRDWVDPVLGVRMAWVFTERQGITVWALGSAGDEVSWDLMASYGLRMTEHSWLRLGYRSLSLREISPGVDLDLTLAGPGLGVEWRY
ncbi:hypothetical protein [Stenotrophomonas oahuensis]|uniref:Outer membrane protein beta-barrel domain-containing protein n=1 Tax=Stenotrophomonas oahuensis TaxID=3003271 RepID=A0ABY9YPY1_9GAMM|nr:hypothetical protein [Stenotrophomonas sp. A5586]WNH52773.1 hypothetical protein PDM29_00445 [Stenotrophomonas sp. A5586]